MSENAMVYVVQNSSRETAVIIEPWAEEFLLPPKAKLSIIFYADLGRLKTGITPEYFIMNVWNGCQAGVFINE